MATSQFTIYTNFDSGAPQLYIITGSMLNILNQCLVTGYGSKLPAGWLKPLADTGSYGMFKQPSGSQCSFFINDQGRATVYTSRYAHLVGFESITDMANGTATGSNQFPTGAQLTIPSGQYTGSVGIAKGALSSSTANPSSSVYNWTVYADHSTCYIFVDNGVVAGTYGSTMFGDIYSFSSSNDPYKAMVIGNHIPVINNTQENFGGFGVMTTVIAGHFLARTYTGAGGSITAGKHGDGAKGSTTAMFGRMMSVNSTDNGVYLCPIYVTEPVASCVRGILRGCWNFLSGTPTDGQTIVGSPSGSFAGKNFKCIKFIGLNNAYCAMETSNTVYTN